MALMSPKAADLLHPLRAYSEVSHHRMLHIAIAVHRTAEEICKSGWTAGDSSPIDLPLLRFCGQRPFQRFMVDLLGSFLPPQWSIDLEMSPTRPGTVERLTELLDLCGKVTELERAGALRLLADEALFASSFCPQTAQDERVSPELLERVEAVLPRAVRGLLDELSGDLNSLLDLYLTFGPVWYRMASQNLLHRGVRESLSDMATEFPTARRFLVRIAQGPLADLRHELFSLAT